MRESLNFVNILKFAGAYVACAIGSGFATGQEVLQFFAGQGTAGYIGALINLVIFAWCGGMFMKHGYMLQLDNASGIIEYYFGKSFGKVMALVFQVFLYGVYVIMIAGSGATLANYYGINPMIGRVLMTILALITVCLSLNKIVDVLGSLGTLIIIFAIGTGLVAFLTHMGDLNSSIALIESGALDITVTAGGGVWAGVLYPGFNGVVVLILSANIGKGASSAKEAWYGGLIGGVLFGLAVFVVALGLTANIESIYSEAVPMLMLAKALSPTFGTIFSIIVICGIYTTTVPMLWGNVSYLARQGGTKFVIWAVVLAVLGLVLGQTDFKVLVNIIYPFSGYAGIILFIAVAYRAYVKKNEPPAGADMKIVHEN